MYAHVSPSNIARLVQLSVQYPCTPIQSSCLRACLPFIRLSYYRQHLISSFVVNAASYAVFIDPQNIKIFKLHKDMAAASFDLK